MLDYLNGERKSDFNNTNVGTSSGVTVTQAAITGDTISVTSIAASGDAAALVSVQSPSGTTIWQQRFASAFTLNKEFSYPLFGAASAAVLVVVSASTSHSEANLNGFYKSN